MRKTIAIIPVFLCALCVFAREGYCRHDHPERWYQTRWCAEQGGRMEVVLEDKSRCDCVTDSHAVEFDFASKWAESVDQAMHYAAQTGKQAGIVLILERTKDEAYLKRLERVIRFNDLPVRIWVIR